MFSYLFICRLPPITSLGRLWLPSTYKVQDNFILINADALLLALKLYLQSIWHKLLKPSCCTKPALSNKVLAHVSTGAPKLPLCLQEPLKLLIAFCANGPYALDKASRKSCTGCMRHKRICSLPVQTGHIESVYSKRVRQRESDSCMNLAGHCGGWWVNSIHDTTTSYEKCVNVTLYGQNT